MINNHHSVSSSILGFIWLPEEKKVCLFLRLNDGIVPCLVTMQTDISAVPESPVAFQLAWDEEDDDYDFDYDDDEDDDDLFDDSDDLDDDFDDDFDDDLDEDLEDLDEGSGPDTDEDEF